LHYYTASAVDPEDIANRNENKRCRVLKWKGRITGSQEAELSPTRLMTATAVDARTATAYVTT
jgi:hypothetical protein